MPTQRNAQLTYTEGTLQLAIQATIEDRDESERRVITAFSVPRSTLRDRRQGALPRRDREPNSKKLSKLEEEALVRRILELDTQGIPATKAMVRDMANDLLAERGEGPVGKHWVDNFKTRTPEITLRKSRPYDRQRALNEDPRVITPWFELVANTKAKYGILDEDMYNFDETGFMMGVIHGQMVFTGSEKRSTKSLQPGNRGWVTNIQGVNAKGWAIPPFIIFPGKVLITSWFHNLPCDWIIEVSPNGWTSNKLGIAWLRHFNTHTKDRKLGAYRLLIVDGHESHSSHEFHKYCKEEKIIVLCMPAHSSHLLQPLDVGCFSPLKRAYGDEISSLARYGSKQIKKEAFLPAFKVAFERSIIKENICASFRGAGLVPHNPEAVLSKLDVVLRTPTPPKPEDTPWESKTPGNLREIEAQSTLVRERVRLHRDSPPSPLLRAVEQLNKGVIRMGHETVLMRQEMAGLRKAVEVATEVRNRKRKYIRTAESLTVGEVADLIAEREAGGQLDSRESAKKVRAKRHCGRCGETGHNARTCAVEILDASNSNKSE